MVHMTFNYFRRVINLVSLVIANIPSSFIHRLSCLIQELIGDRITGEENDGNSSSFGVTYLW